MYYIPYTYTRIIPGFCDHSMDKHLSFYISGNCIIK